MVSEIVEYIRTYPDYQRVRVYYYKPYNELVLILPGGVNLFYTIIMNFIIDILPTRNSYTNKTYDIILVLVDKLIKYITYIVTIKDLKVDRLVDII